MPVVYKILKEILINMILILLCQLLLGAAEVVSVERISATFSSPKFCLNIQSMYNTLNTKDDKSHKIGIL